MIPKLGEVWLVDMGIAGKVRPAVVVLDDAVPLERSLIVHVPVTSQNRGTVLEVPLGHLRFLSRDSTANVQAIARCLEPGLSEDLEVYLLPILRKSGRRCVWRSDCSAPPPGKQNDSASAALTEARGS